MLRLVEIDVKEFRKNIFKEYTKLFPASERKPYILLEKLYNRGILKILKIADNDTFIGFILANSLNGNRCLQVDYFGIFPKYQNMGYGTKAIELLKESSKDYYGIFIEVEKEGLGKNDEENKLRKRRINFYERLGFCKLNFDMNLYNVIYTPYILQTTDEKENENQILKDIVELYIGMQGEKRFKKYCRIIQE